MKVYRYIVFLACLVSAGCAKTVVDDAGMSRTYDVSFCLTGETEDTKVVDADWTAEMIDHVQLFVYEGERLEACVLSELNPVTVSLTVGVKQVFVVCNAPEVPAEDCKTLSALLSYRSRLADNSPELMQMSGRAEVVIAGNDEFTMKVARLCSLVLVDRIDVDPSSTLLAHETLTLKAIYLTNTAADALWWQDSGPLQWYNKRGWQGDEPSYLRDEPNAPLAGGYTGRHTFLAYPNPTMTDSHALAWGPRFTRLVLKVGTTTLGDVYYSVNVPHMERNHWYRFTRITLRSAGLDDEEGEYESVPLTWDFTGLIPWGSDTGERTELL